MLTSSNYSEKSEKSVLPGDTYSSTPGREISEVSEISPFALYFALCRRGVTFSIHGDRLRINPADQVSADELEQIRTHKRWLVLFVKSPPELWEGRLTRIRTLTPELQALIKDEWFDGREVDLDELTPDEIRALARDGRRYQVKASAAPSKVAA